ncbi:MAG TPA: family 78 glycoside hydrolase catalytic domain [Trebonia sp.]|nr:family 78 glycoside hydrolase catalytic domain [Trebonia sp.]
MSSLTAYDLRCEQLTEPLGLDEPSPCFSWRLRSAAGGQRQTAYRLRLAAAPWDSGWVTSGDHAAVAYEGPPLRPRTRYEWSLELRDVAGAACPPVSSAFETGIGSWAARWIHADPTIVPPAQPPGVSDRSERTRRLTPPVQFRRAFSLAAAPAGGRAYVAARGLYELRVNGVRAGDQELAPGWTEYLRRIQYQAYDITALLRAGENVVAVTVADGWWCGYVGADTRHHARHYGVRPELIAQIVADGVTIGTGTTWRYGEGAVCYADLLMGNWTDARAATDGWDRPGFDDSAWPQAVLSDTAEVALVAQPDQPVRVCSTLPALSVTPVAGQPGRRIVDFGQNMAGRVRLTVRDAPAARVITVRHGEALEPDGRLYTSNLRTAEATDVYVTGGDPVEVFEPSFTVHGFRYAEVTGHTFAAGDVAAQVMHNDTPPVGEFECSSPLLSRLAANIAWGQRSNFVAVPTDCPQRDERQGWLADAQVFAPTACRHADLAAFFPRWLRDVRDGQNADGAFGDIAPMVGVRPEGAPGWGDAGVLIPWQLWLEYGHKRVLEQSWDSMTRWLGHIERSNPDLLWRRRAGNNYGDWLHLGEDTPRDLVATAYFARSARVVADTARVIGRDPRSCDDLAARICAAFAAEFIRPDGEVGHGTQTGYLLALAFGLVPEDLTGPAFARLAGSVARHGPLTGFLGLALLCPVLTAGGRADLAYQVLLRTEYPSLGYQIAHGATTIWERWDGWTDERGFQAAEMNSFNHYALGAVGDWLYGTVAGIGQRTAAYRDIVIAPVPGGGLTWARARQTTVRGLISSEWRITGDRLVVEVDLPPGRDCEVILPGGARHVVVPGRHTMSAAWPAGSPD